MKPGPGSPGCVRGITVNYPAGIGVWYRVRSPLQNEITFDAGLTRCVLWIALNPPGGVRSLPARLGQRKPGRQTAGPVDPALPVSNWTGTVIT
jgi:hypothetical protein